MVKNNTLVMVVDDEPSMCNILKRILMEDGYKVITASNGKRALELAKENKPDVILLDVMLPGMNGREVCRRIREFSPKTPIIYLTAKAAPSTPSALKEFHNEADAFIAKPATSKQILSKVSGVLKGTR